MNRLWYRHIKSSPESHSDFLAWLAEHKERVRAGYAKAPSWDDTLRLQGEERAIDNLLRTCTMENREARQVEDFRKRTGT